MQPIVRTNDFVVKFANVNGSGSASANELFAKAILAGGVQAGDTIQISVVDGQLTVGARAATPEPALTS